MNLKNLLISAFTLLYLPILSAQGFNLKDSSRIIPMLTGHYSFDLPGGDLAKRFGYNSNIGGSFIIKTKTNWFYGFEGSFLFGNQIKEDTILNIISNKQGYIIDEGGAEADITLSERGFYLSLIGGKIIPWLGPNPNSGIMINGTAGFLEHKIRTDIEDNTPVPQLEGDYKNGYDRLTSGFAISEFIGYMYLGNRRLISFFGGFEFTQAWTVSRVKWDFDRMGADNTKRHDYLYAIKFGWIIPLYPKRERTGYYFY